MLPKPTLGVKPQGRGASPKRPNPQHQGRPGSPRSKRDRPDGGTTGQRGVTQSAEGNRTSGEAFGRNCRADARSNERYPAAIRPTGDAGSIRGARSTGDRGRDTEAHRPASKTPLVELIGRAGVRPRQRVTKRPPSDRWQPAKPM
jgi:hypothetical protein